MGDIIDFDFKARKEPVDPREQQTAAAASVGEIVAALHQQIVGVLLEQEFGDQIAEEVAKVVKGQANRALGELDELRAFHTSANVPGGLDVEAACRVTAAQLKQQIEGHVGKIFDRAQGAYVTLALCAVTALACAIKATLNER